MTDNRVRDEDLAAVAKWAALSNEIIYKICLELQQRRADEERKSLL